MTRRTVALLAGVGMLVAAATAQAQIPRLINFQGRLADASGTPLSGSYSMTFSFWTAASGGTSCFSETQAAAANSGLFNVNIGSATTGGIAAACDFATGYYLQLQIGTDSPMSPRIPMTASAYALRAEKANDSDKLGGFTVGTGSGNVPRNSGELMTNLNADTVDGYHASAFAMGSHTHPLAALSCVTKTATLSGYDCEPVVTCDAGYQMTGGGASSGGIKNYPYGNGWFCYLPSSPDGCGSGSTCYARCCKNQ